jgi:membrane protease YdiL (CAAX protease family)
MRRLCARVRNLLADLISAHRLGARPGVSEEILRFGSASPAMAAIFLSRSGRKVFTASLTTRLLWFGLLWAPCWAIYVVSDKMRGVTTATSVRFGLIVALLAAIPAWIGSGAFSSDSGVRKLLRTVTVRRNWRWQAVAFFSFPVILLVPTAILHAFGLPVVWQRGGGTLWSLAAYGALMFLRNLFFTSFSEEPGWRGYLLPHLQRRFSPLFASLLVWLPWALWHAPLDFNISTAVLVSQRFKRDSLSTALRKSWYADVLTGAAGAKVRGRPGVPAPNALDRPSPILSWRPNRSERSESYFAET